MTFSVPMFLPWNLAKKKESFQPVAESRDNFDVNARVNTLQNTMGYHSPQNSLWQDKHGSPKSSPLDDDQMRLNGGSPQQLSPPGSSPSSEQNNLKRRAAEPLQHITELDKKHIRRDGWYYVLADRVSALSK